MEHAFEFADPLGPAKIIHVYEPSIGLQMAPDVSTRECFRLARAMTCALRDCKDSIFGPEENRASIEEIQVGVDAYWAAFD